MKLGNEFGLLDPRKLAAENLVPGWSHHGGGGSGRVEKEGGNHYLRLDASAISRTHNAFYLDQQAGILDFDLRVPEAGVGETLLAKIGEDVIGTVSLDSTSTTFERVQLVVPTELRGKAQDA